jgi:hypothetical protein
MTLVRYAKKMTITDVERCYVLSNVWVVNEHYVDGCMSHAVELCTV